MLRAMILATIFVYSSIAAADEKETPPTADHVKEIVETVCSACHGANGNSTVPAHPTLAGQDAAYLFKQLKEFKSAEGKPAVRDNPVMTAITTTLSEEDMKALSLYFSRQTAIAAPPSDEKPATAGKDLWRKGSRERGIPACTGCHGPAGAGVPPQYPRLAGQHAEYTELQLKNFTNEERSNDQNRMMRIIAEKLSGKQIKALADYIASLR